MSEVSRGDAEKAARDGAKKLDDVSRNPGVLAGLIDDIKTMIDLISDAVHGRYREVPWATVAAVAGAIIYFVSPIDLIPDFFPLIGYTDDAGVIAGVLAACKHDIAAYRRWRAERS